MNASIIIPIYNGEKYITNMVSKLENQTFSDFEIIFINDGSQDRSKSILEECSKKDNRIIVINQSNHGICAARNTGLENASGDYIIFLDQDDEIEQNLVEEYVMLITKSGADMAAFGKIHHIIQDDKVLSITPQSFESEVVNSHKKIFEYLFNLDNKKRLMTIWNCIYRKSIIDTFSIRFDEHFKHGDEDGMFNTEYALHCNKIAFSNKCLYNYYIRKGISTITKPNKDLLDDYLYYIDKVIRLSSSEDDYENSLVQLFCLRFFSNVYTRYCRFHTLKKEKIAFLKETEHSKAFQYATNFSNKKFSRIFGKKYYFWNVFNYSYSRKQYTKCMHLLNALVFLKQHK